MSQVKFSLRELADFLGCEFLGDPDAVVTAIATLEDAGPDQLTFLAQGKFEKYLPQCTAGILVIRATQSDLFAGNKLLVDDPYLAYARLSRVFDRRRRADLGVHPTAIVAATAKLSEGVRIGPGVVIGEDACIGADTEVAAGCVIGDGCQIGARCLLYPKVTVYDFVVMGSDVTVHSGTVLGADGFGYAPSRDGWIKIHQLASVVIGNRVEIGANTTIDRGALTDTIIEDGVIIDNLIHIAHGVKIGEGSAIAACVGIAGSTTIGKHCTIGGAVGIAGHLTIADNTHFHGGTIVTKNVGEAGTYASATPLQEVRKWRRNSVRYNQLDDMAVRLKKLEKNED